MFRQRKEHGREDTVCKDEGDICSCIINQVMDGRNGSEVNSRYGSFRGPEFYS